MLKASLSPQTKLSSNYLRGSKMSQLNLRNKYLHEVFDKLMVKVFTDVTNQLRVKGGEYAGDTDRLANFRRNALAMGVPAEVIWGVYAGKHWDSIMQYVNDTAQNKTRTRAEPMCGRAHDLIAYLILFIAMEDEKARQLD